MVSEEDKKRIDTWLDKHLKELSQPEDGSTARCPWAYSSKVPIVHTDQYMDIMKNMINFPYDDGIHGLLIVLHGVLVIIVLIEMDYILDKLLLIVF